MTAMSLAYYCGCGAQWHGALVASSAARQHRRAGHPVMTHEQFIMSARADCQCLPCRQGRAAARKSAASKAAWADPAVRAKMSAASKAAWADPAVRAKMSAASKAALADPAVRAKMSAARKAAWADPAVRAKRSGRNHWTWRRNAFYRGEIARSPR